MGAGLCKVKRSAFQPPAGNASQSPPGGINEVPIHFLVLCFNANNNFIATCCTVLRESVSKDRAARPREVVCSCDFNTDSYLSTTY